MVEKQASDIFPVHSYGEAWAKPRSHFIAGPLRIEFTHCTNKKGPKVTKDTKNMHDIELEL